ncbi:MAG: PD-(D/E)XK nuclease family protein [Ktedonobacteraceae bacterium]|nr:PD-(D/E)XK nuclease family protein [Ktedonobacteraceae bacterium]
MSVQVEKDDYILTGKIDLLRRTNDGIEILDFKTRPRPDAGSSHLALFKQQLYLYAYAMPKKTGQLPQRLFLYWTAESKKEDALMEVPYTERQVEEVNAHLDEVATNIGQRNFTIDVLPEAGVCRVCDIRLLCKREGLYK